VDPSAAALSADPMTVITVVVVFAPALPPLVEYKLARGRWHGFAANFAINSGRLLPRQDRWAQEEVVQPEASFA
jgi:hypothetical protein